MKTQYLFLDWCVRYTPYNTHSHSVDNTRILKHLFLFSFKKARSLLLQGLCTCYILKYVRFPQIFAWLASSVIQVSAQVSWSETFLEHPTVYLFIFNISQKNEAPQNKEDVLYSQHLEQPDA